MFLKTVSLALICYVIFKTPWSFNHRHLLPQYAQNLSLPPPPVTCSFSFLSYLSEWQLLCYSSKTKQNKKFCETIFILTRVSIRTQTVPLSSVSEDAEGNYTGLPRTILDKAGLSYFLSPLSYLDINHQIYQFYLLNIS